MLPDTSEMPSESLIVTCCEWAILDTNHAAGANFTSHLQHHQHAVHLHTLLTLCKFFLHILNWRGVEPLQRQLLTKKASKMTRAARSTNAVPAESQAPARELWILRGTMHIELAKLASCPSANRLLHRPANTKSDAMQTALF